MIFNSTYVLMKSTLEIPICWWYDILLNKKKQPLTSFFVTIVKYWLLK